jgi:asparagine N-glycosylation enzyme membrane subunit Stt3
LNQEPGKGKSALQAISPILPRLATSSSIRTVIALLVFALALALRAHDGSEPYDDLYHAKRIAWSAAHFPHSLELDPDRGFAGAFCPWPPLYDAVCGLVARLFGMGLVSWLPPLGFSLFAASLSWLTGRRGGPLAAVTAGACIALSPYLIAISSTGAIDHHWTEPVLVLLIAAATLSGSPLVLGAAIAGALLVQTALIVAAGLVFVAIFFLPPLLPPAEASRAMSSEDTIGVSIAAPRTGAIGFALAALIISVYRVTRPDAYPSNQWFLGWTHVALLCAAGVACALLAAGLHRPVALAAGGLSLVPVMPAISGGLTFFRGDPWLRTIVEFQPLFSDRAAIGTDLANLTGAAVLTLTLGAELIFKRKAGPVSAVLTLFAVAYLALALSSRRFLVVGIPLFALCGALMATRMRSGLLALVVMAATIVPPLLYDIYSVTHPEYEERAGVIIRMAAAMKSLPPGRVLARWGAGHAIDVLGGHPVVVDNFGSMPDVATFYEASRALLSPDLRILASWCRAHSIRYVVLDDPSLAAAIGAAIGSPAIHDPLAWKTLYVSASPERGGFRRVYGGGGAQIWMLE